MAVVTPNRRDSGRTRRGPLDRAAHSVAHGLIAPDDEHNRELVANVHPPDWQNPEPRKRYHLVVLGAGTAGLVSAVGAAGLGANVAIVERHLIGGDCLNVGCVPSKGVISAARAWSGAANAHLDFGAPEPGAAAGDFPAVMRRVRRLRARISHHDSARRLAGLGIDVFLGSGFFTGSDTLEVDGKELRFRRAVIATGGRAVAPPIPGLEDIDYLTNETIFSLTERPGRLGVIGGGPIGCEMAQAFARLGSRVSLLEAADHVLSREDPDAARIVQEAMARDGVDLRIQAQVTRVGSLGEGVEVCFSQGGSGESSVVVDRLLVAVGRAPNTDGLCLSAAGVKDHRHGVEVDDRLRTSNRRIFACGDVASRFKFTHTADAQARIVLQNALFFGRAKASKLIVPWCTYTSPEVAHVGIYEADAREGGYEVDTLTLPLSAVDRAVLDGEEDGFLRLHLRKGSDRILGATLVAAHAGDMLSALCIAITAGVGLGTIARTIHAYPTQGEILKKAADQWRAGKLTPRVRRVFDRWFRTFR